MRKSVAGVGCGDSRGSRSATPAAATATTTAATATTTTATAAATAAATTTSGGGATQSGERVGATTATGREPTAG